MPQTSVSQTIIKMIDFIYNILILPLQRIAQTIIVCFSTLLSEDIDYTLVVLFSAVIINLLLYFIYQRIICITDVAKQTSGIANRILCHLMLFVRLWFFIVATFVFTNFNIFNEKKSFYVMELGDYYVDDFLISDMLKPDGLIELENITINIIPILFILISIITLVLYYKKVGQKYREQSNTANDKISYIIDNIDPFIYVIVVSFVLYNSAATLTFFYVVTAVFSLIRVLLNDYILKKKIEIRNYSFDDKKELKKYNLLVIVLLLTWALILGVMIPSQVMSVSPSEFVTFGQKPIHIIAFTGSVFSLYAGYLFLFYLLLNKKQKRIFIIVMSIVCVFAIMNFMLFGNEFGIVTVMLNYEMTYVEYELISVLLNIGLLLLISVITILLSKIKNIGKDIILIIGIAVLMFSSYNAYNIYNTTKNIVPPKMFTEEELKPIYTLSTNKNNVIVLMIDRMAGSIFPHILELCPELKDKYDGFTYYPNTLSFGSQTTIGTPGLFGGYEYIPSESDRVVDKLVLEKHNEALTLMPRVFGENGYDVVCSNLPDVNYWDGSRPSPFKGLKNVQVKSMRGRLDTSFLGSYKEGTIDTQKNNFVCFSFMRTVPVFLHEILYNDGRYTCAESDRYRYTQTFINDFLLLKSLPKLTDAKKTKNGSVIIMDNGTTHESVPLSYPDFDLLKIGDEKVDINSIDNGERATYHFGAYDYYGTCVATIKKVADWLDHIKTLGVYDNTRIIIVSDHGYHTEGQHKNVVVSKKSKYKTTKPQFSKYTYNPLFLVKDFNEHGFKISEEFMTNADTPYLATKDLIDNPVNDITNRAINMDYKNNNKKLYLAGFLDPWQPTFHQNEYQYETANRCFIEVDTSDMWDDNNWDYISDYVGNVCLAGMNHKLTKIEKSDKETCGIKFINDVYECENCHKYFADAYASEALTDTSDYIEDVPHKFVDYISNNDVDIESKTHGTLTAECAYGCGTKDTKYDMDPNGYHKMDKSYVKVGTTNEDGYNVTICDICGLELEGSKKVIPKIDKIELEYNDVVYDGKEHRPKVYVYDSEGNIINDDNYNVHYHRTSAIGMADAEIIFKNRYDGRVYKYYAIHPQKMTSVVCEMDGDVLKIVYDGSTDKINGYEVEFSTEKTFGENNVKRIDAKKSEDKEIYITDIDDVYKNNKIYVRMRPYRISQMQDADGINQEIRIYGDWAGNT